ncbi:hypothetical protein BBP40_010756 [Aspergillus hancockii]|nr:hypothetical protein BBP40_010756 [Aspergillus hancockii]
MQKLDAMDEQATLEDPMISPRGLMVLLPVIPASIRRHIPRLYPSFQRSMRPDPNPRTDSTGDLQRPATWGSSSNDQDSCGSSVSGKLSETSSITAFEETKGLESMGTAVSKYEESGLRWNRVNPAINLLRIACFEGQQPQCDGRLVRSLYINALCYHLEGLPVDLTFEEAARIQQSLHPRISTPLVAPSPAGFVSQPVHARYPTERSYLHRLLASSIVQFFILLQILTPYLKIVVHRVYQYERSHRVTERVVSATLDAAEQLGKRGVNLGSTVLSLHDGKVGVAVSNLAAWLVEGIAGGVYEGIGEGMTILGFIRPNSGVGGAPMQPIPDLGS